MVGDAHPDVFDADRRFDRELLLREYTPEHDRRIAGVVFYSRPQSGILPIGTANKFDLYVSPLDLWS